MNHFYKTANSYFKERFGFKVYKLALDGGMTCPNRDGTLGTRGCIFCSGGGSGDFAQKQCGDIKLQLEQAKARLSGKNHGEHFIAYFQSFTNTYGDIDYLEKQFRTAIEREDIVALSIGTRPDCLPTEVLEMLENLNKIKPVWIELGLQTSNEKTAEYIRRYYPNSTYKNAVKELKSRGITVITHIIIGLPNETKEDILNTVDFAVKSGTDGVKLQLLHILKDTDLYEDYKLGKVKVLSFEEYIDILFSCIEKIPKNIVIHRITGDAPKKYLIEPKWSADKKMVLNTINKELEKRDIMQGRYAL